MNSIQLTYFKYVADEMNVTKASRKLFVTQSAVSQQLRSLAEELECTLFYRKGNRLHLTLEGEFVYEKAKAIVTQMEHLPDELKSMSGKVVGCVKIGSGPVTSKNLLPEIVSATMGRYPGISFSLFEIYSTHLPQALIEARIDLGIGQINEEDERIHSEKLMTGHLVLVCSSRNRWSKRKSVSLRELSKLNLIHRINERDNVFLSKVSCFNGKTRHFQLEMMNTETIIPYLKRDMGMALAPDYAIDMLSPEGICKIPLEEEIAIPWGILRDKHSPVSRAEQIFIDKLKESFPGGTTGCNKTLPPRFFGSKTER